MANEAWLSGKLDGYAPEMMPAAHALTQSAADLQRFSANLTSVELNAQINYSSSVAFHLKHIAGSIDRLLTYSQGDNLTAAQLDFLQSESKSDDKSSAAELTASAIQSINDALAVLRITAPESIFEPRFVGRQKLPTNVFGLLFHIAEHTARHVGQIISIAQTVKFKADKPSNFGQA